MSDTSFPMEISQNMLLSVKDSIIHQLRIKTPEQVRASLAHSDFTGASAAAQPDLMWHDMVHKPPIDEIALKELKQFNLMPVKPGGRIMRSLTYARTLLRAVGAESSSINPTPAAKKIDPVYLHAFTSVDEGAMADLRTDVEAFMAGQYTDDLDAIVDTVLDLSLSYAALASLVNLNINGDTGGSAGLNHYNGILKQLADGSPQTYDLASTAYLATVFPAMWDKFNESCDPAYLQLDDIAIWCSLYSLEKYRLQVLSDKQNEQGFYDKATGETKFGRATVYGFRDWPTNRIVLANRSNLPLGLINSPMKITKEFSVVKGARATYMSAPLHAHGVVVDIANTVYARP